MDGYIWLRLRISGLRGSNKDYDEEKYVLVPKDEDQEDYAREWADGVMRHHNSDHYTVHFDVVGKLPLDIYERMKRRQTSIIGTAQFVLDVLEATPKED